MNWIFLNRKTIKEKNTGYILRLVSGTWLDPEEIIPEAPKTPQLLRQSELLRRGLEFAYDCEQRNRQAEASLA